MHDHWRNWGLGEVERWEIREVLWNFHHKKVYHIHLFVAALQLTSSVPERDSVERISENVKVLLLLWRSGSISMAVQSPWFRLQE